MLGEAARFELREAKEEQEYQLRRYRSLACHRHDCDDDLERELLADLAEAKAALLAVVWASSAGRGATSREIAEVLGVELRTVERYKTDFRRGLARNQRSTVE